MQILIHIMHFLKDSFMYLEVHLALMLYWKPVIIQFIVPILAGGLFYLFLILTDLDLVRQLIDICYPDTNHTYSFDKPSS